MSSPNPHGGAEARARLNVPRLMIVLACIAGAVVVVRWPLFRTNADAHTAAWFGPYVDTTLTPSYPFGDTRFNPGDRAVLGFVVADHTTPCAPSWGGYYTPDEAVRAIDLDRRIATLRARGGEPIVSFGGAVNTELAVACTDQTALDHAYASIVTRYRLRTIDLDLEGATLSDPVANARRARAIANVQHRAAAPLAVWVTLPVATDGLTADGVSAVRALLQGGVQLAGVNVMTMNLGDPAVGEVESDLVQKALMATSKQVAELFGAVGIDLSEETLWARLGATVMIGRNDNHTEVFTLDDARRLVTFADTHRMARISMWSMNRDAPCGSTVDDGVAQNDCSGVEQQPSAFGTIFAERRDAVADTASPTSVAVDPAKSRTDVVADDPATAPYPIWMSGRSYQSAEKVVWHGNVYQSKWWNQNQEPDAPAASAWASPWTLVGPVLPTDRPAPTTTIPSGTYPDWDATKGYTAGTKVQHQGAAFIAKWYTIGQEPGALVANPWDTPWAPFSPADDHGTVPTSTTPNVSSPSTSTTGVTP